MINIAINYNSNRITNDFQVSNNNSSLEEKKIDIDLIFNKIAPYLEKPKYIKEFLKKHSNKTSDRIKVIIEHELEKKDEILRTDLRILLNAID